MDEELTAELIDAGGKHYLKAEIIIWLNHSRSSDELNHCSLKEQLPIDQFSMNGAYYYLSVISRCFLKPVKTT